MDDLQADIKVEDKTFTGAGPLDGAEDFVANIENIWREGAQVDETQLAIDGMGMALDAAGFLTDPLATLASSAIGWVIENVEWVREPFDNLFGDPPAIEAAANTWSNISQHLGDVAGQHKGSMSQVTEWHGQSGRAYRGAAANLFDHTRNAEVAAAAVANKIKLAGATVAATRALVRDSIAEMVGTLLAWGAACLASSWFTFGGSVAAFIARAVAKAVEIAGRIAQYLKKLFSALDKLGGLAKTSADGLRRRADELASSGRTRSEAGLDGRLRMKEEHMSEQLRNKADSRDALAGRIQGQGLDARNQRVDNVTDSANTRAENLRQTANRWDEQGGPLANTSLGRVADRVDAHGNKSTFDGGNVLRSLSGDLFAHRPTWSDAANVKPGWGDAVTPAKEFAKEYNKAFLQEEGNSEENVPTEKPHESTTREVRGERDV